MNADEISEQAVLDMLGHANTDLILKIYKPVLTGRQQRHSTCLQQQMLTEQNLMSLSPIC